jgi:hypothetical protein
VALAGFPSEPSEDLSSPVRQELLSEGSSPWSFYSLLWAISLEIVMHLLEAGGFGDSDSMPMQPQCSVSEEPGTPCLLSLLVHICLTIHYSCSSC